MASRSPQKTAVDTGAVATDDYMTSLARRVEALEKKLLGEKEGRGGQPPLRNTVASVDRKLQGLTNVGVGKAGGHVTEVWSKIDCLERLLSPEHGSYAKLSEESKEELLVGKSQRLKPLCDSLEEIQQLKDYLNTTEFQGLDSHERKLASVARKHGEQEQQVEWLSQEVRTLLETYQKIMLQLSAQCVEWDELLTRLESKS